MKDPEPPCEPAWVYLPELTDFEMALTEEEREAASRDAEIEHNEYKKEGEEI